MAIDDGRICMGHAGVVPSARRTASNSNSNSNSNAGTNSNTSTYTNVR